MISEPLASEVESRLEELFGEDGDAPETGQADHDRLLDELRALVLSIEWEITDVAMSNLIESVDKLRSLSQANKTGLTFLQLLHSLGVYIRKYRSKAHPDSIKLLNSIFSGYERTSLEQEMPEAERRKILAAEVAKFKQLKERITRQSNRQPAKNTSPPACKSPTPVAGTDEEYQKAILRSLQEIKEIMNNEFKALRAQLRSSCPPEHGGS